MLDTTIAAQITKIRHDVSISSCIYSVQVLYPDVSCASYLDLHLEIVSEGQLRTKFYHKVDDSKLPNCELSI